MKKKVSFTSAIWKERRHYVAQCLNIDISSFGKTKKEALNNLTEALELYLEDKHLRIPTVKMPSIEVGKLQYA